MSTAVVSADKAPSYPSVNPKYDFSWQVSDGYSNNNYGQKESRDGANTVGSYFVNRLLILKQNIEKKAYFFLSLRSYFKPLTIYFKIQPDF